ncbi:alginate lyase family protein [Amycolatopsis sp. FU40]|uniref:alginate lyase family protein n=1 Tax=Amycolatopsis sp. FU40 TaxID=2914159 RepID=UPI001F15A436|nr:alginate lyase family protein [Amycolatopsis sp. FU40]UKD58351.1 alginate lyase family protein [Amycolatopsis sp. FU40]
MLPPFRSSRPRRLAAVLATVAGLLATTAGAATAAPAPRSCSFVCVPDPVVLDGLRLAGNKIGLMAGNPTLRTSLSNLLKQADDALTKGPWTVVDKERVPPSGDKHDYLSLAPYYWPSQPKTPENPQGCPYVDRDGQVNPEMKNVPDKAERLVAFNSIYQLSLAWYYTGKAEYAQRAALDLRTWFLDAATKMNPNLNFAQGIPCKTDGRGIGIIEFSYTFTQVLDAARILEAGAPGWTKADGKAFRGWSADFLTWLRTSKNGTDEAKATNNHGTFYDLLAAATASYVGRRDLAREIVRDSGKARIDHQIAADGGQPEESTRTRTYHYHTFNLVALTRLAQLGKHLGVDLWSYRNPQGGSIFAAVDHLLPAATGAAPWPLPDIHFIQYAALDSVHAAADAGDRKARAAVGRIPVPPGGDLFPVRPAAEQLDDVSTT